MEIKFKVGQTVYYLYNGMIKQSKIEKIVIIPSTLRYVLLDGYYVDCYFEDSGLEENKIFATFEEAKRGEKFQVLQRVKKTVDSLNDELQAYEIKVRVEMKE